jgi:uncharacterized protein YkwD
VKYLFYLLLIFPCLASFAQINPKPDSLNTAKNCSYMTAKERDMIYEINRVRSDPRSYLQYIEPLLVSAEQKLKENGKGGRNYSLTTTTFDGGKKQIDTTWHFINEEEVHALKTLVEDLKKLERLSILKPDEGIYKAATKHAVDQAQHDWTLGHTGTDGSAPWDRITKFSPTMSFGNENIAGNSMIVTARDIVIQLLVDEGIPGYGHRYNLLDPQWTYVGCKGERFKGHMDWWIQDFGVKKKKSGQSSSH